MSVLHFTDALSGRAIDLEVRDVVLAGYTGRDQAAVRRHVEELEAHGVRAPERVPAFYRVTPELVVAADRIEVLGGSTSGEGEYILFRADGDLFVGVGSDHTDRAVEAQDVAKSKQLCHKVVGTSVWRLAEMRSHWEHVVLRSFGDSDAHAYQAGPAASLLDPEEILRRVAARTGAEGDGLLVFSGTLPLAGDLEYASRFRVELADEEHELRLEVAYRVEVKELLD